MIPLEGVFLLRVYVDKHLTLIAGLSDVNLIFEARLSQVVCKLLFDETKREVESCDKGCFLSVELGYVGQKDSVSKIENDEAESLKNVAEQLTNVQQ